jgi:hypothetical protein
MLTQYLERSRSHCIAPPAQAFIDTRQVIKRGSECGRRWILRAAERHRTPRCFPEALHVVDQNRPSSALAHLHSRAAGGFICSKHDRLLIPDDVCSRLLFHGATHSSPLASVNQLRVDHRIGIAAIATALDRRQCRRRPRVLFYHLVVNRRCET